MSAIASQLIGSILPFSVNAIGFPPVAGARQAPRNPWRVSGMRRRAELRCNIPRGIWNAHGEHTERCRNRSPKGQAAGC